MATDTERALCYSCGEPVTIPPGVFHRGLKLHRHCAQVIRHREFSEEVTAPRRAEQLENVQSYLYNMGNHPS